MASESLLFKMELDNETSVDIPPCFLAKSKKSWKGICSKNR